MDIDAQLSKKSVRRKSFSRLDFNIMRSRPRSVGVNRLNQYASRITGQTEEKLFTVVPLQDVVKKDAFFPT